MANPTKSKLRLAFLLMTTAFILMSAVTARLVFLSYGMGLAVTLASVTGFFSLMMLWGGRGLWGSVAEGERAPSDARDFATLPKPATTRPTDSLDDLSKRMEKLLAKTELLQKKFPPARTAKKESERLMTISDTLRHLTQESLFLTYEVLDWLAKLNARRQLPSETSHKVVEQIGRQIEGWEAIATKLNTLFSQNPPGQDEEIGRINTSRRLRSKARRKPTS